MVDRAQALLSYLNGLDRGQIITARVVQVMADEVRIALGPGTLWARTRGGRPGLGMQRMEVLQPGARPAFRMVRRQGGSVVDLCVDASHEKAARMRGLRIDQQA
jgi:hypothetical protein